MKKKVSLILLVAALISMVGCMEPRQARIVTEAQDNLQTTYVFDTDDKVVSKTVHNTSSDIITEYVYYYHYENGVRTVKGINVITISPDGKILAEYTGGPK